MTDSNQIDEQVADMIDEQVLRILPTVMLLRLDRCFPNTPIIKSVIEQKGSPSVHRYSSEPDYNTDKFTEWQDMAYRQLRTNQLQQLERMAIRECEKISGNIVPSMPPRLMHEIERREAIRMRMEKLGVDIE